MKPRLIIALLCATLALFILGIRYGPASVAVHAIGDPSDQLLLVGFLPPERDRELLVRRSLAAGTLDIPLNDGRGALSATLRLRSEQAGISVLTTAQQTLIVPTIAQFRHYAVLAPPRAERNFSMMLAANSGGAVIIDEVVVMGRPAWPAMSDVSALLLIAAMPALLMVLTRRLPLDWATVASLLVLCGLVLLPAEDYGAWLAYGPFVTLGVGLLAAIPWARARPTFALILLLGAGLRFYALGWGSGHVFHPEEQAIVHSNIDGAWLQLLQGAGLFLRIITGEDSWQDGWHLVLLGRGLSAAIGTALIWVVYLLGVQLLRPRWALLATAFVACVPVLVQQSHMAGMAQLITLLVALLLLTSTLVVTAPGGHAGLTSVAVSLILLYNSPLVWPWLLAPLVARFVVRRQARAALPMGAAVVTLVLLGSAGWVSRTMALGVDSPGAAAQTSSATPAYIYPLFNILLWGLGPLLMQLGVVGWGAGVIQAFQLQRERKWLPLLLGAAVAFAIAGRGPTYSLNALLPLVPVLSLTAAFLLQTFSQRLRFGFGQRTLRLLAATAVILALATSVGLINVYRGPDPRVAASRWLVAHLRPDDTLRADAVLQGQLPLGAAAVYHAAALDPAAANSDALQAYAAMIAETDYFVTMLERDDVGPGLGRVLPGHTRLDMCTYGALLDGRLGFVERTSFVAQPRIGSWTIDDRRADSMMRSYDHPQLHIYEKVVTPSAAALEQMLRC